MKPKRDFTYTKPYLIGADEFARKWGADLLVRLPNQEGLTEQTVSPDAYEFLTRVGLPALVTFCPRNPELKIAFWRLASGLFPVLREETVGPPMPTEWFPYRVLGNIFFCNGSAWCCIHQETGHVVKIDIELAKPINFINSSVAHFASALALVSSWAEECGFVDMEWPKKVDRLIHDMGELDSESMRDNRTFWKSYLIHIQKQGPQMGEFKRGSMEEGRIACMSGPW